MLYLSQRDNNSLNKFQVAVDKTLALRESNSKELINYNLEIALGNEMPELSIIDYLMWAVQRNLLKGESRYFDVVKSKYETVKIYIRRRINKKLKNLLTPVPVLSEG